MLKRHEEKQETHEKQKLKPEHEWSHDGIAANCIRCGINYFWNNLDIENIPCLTEEEYAIKEIIE